MTSGQRKAHKYIWLLITLLIPLVIIFAVKDLNLFDSENKTGSTFEASKKKLIKQSENDLIKASLYESSIEIILKSTIKNSSAVVYATDTKGNRKDLIGQLTTTGIYNFNINNLPKGILIYDALKKENITKLTFQWD